MPDTPNLKPGWYTTDQEGRRYWTGTEWVTPGGSSPTDGPPAPPDAAVSVSETPKRPRRKRLFIGGAATLALVAAGGLFLLQGSQSDRQAITLCEDALRDSLKSPSTAVFYNSTVMTWGEHMRWYVDEGPGQARGYSDADRNEFVRNAEAADRELEETGGYSAYVVGEVDAQNSYGALERSPWSCLAIGEAHAPTVGVVITFGDEYDYFDTN